MLAVDGLERELLQRLLLENLNVLVVNDLEAVETLVWGDDVRDLVENLIDCLAASCTKAISFSVFADFYVCDIFVV